MVSVLYTSELVKEYPNLKVGKHTYGQPLLLPKSADVTIGAFCSIAMGVELSCMGDHHYEHVSLYPFDNIDSWELDTSLSIVNRPNDIIVGSDVWLGLSSKVLHGSRIGDGAVVGAYAVVAGTVRPYAVVVGNPAREIRRRFSDDVVDMLLQIKWWDWPDEKIMENLCIITSPDVERLR